MVRRSRRNFERGQGEADRGQYDASGEVFGADACAGLYARAMLEDVAVRGEIFDEDFFAYREIVDLSWRARLRGWRTVYEPEAVAFHCRTFSPATRSAVSPRLKRLSLKNRYLMILKNETLRNYLRHLPWIASFDAVLLIYLLFFDPRTLAAFGDLLRILPRALRRRRAFWKRDLPGERDIHTWFS